MDLSSLERSVREKIEDKGRNSKQEKNNLADDAAFRMSSQIHTASAYEDYLRDYPSGLHAREAANSLNALVNEERSKDEAAFQEAVTSSSAEAFDNYLIKYPLGTYSSEAKKIRDILGASPEPKSGWLELVEGNPGMPNDGILIKPYRGAFNNAFELSYPPRLSQFSEGFTISVYIPSGQDVFQALSFQIVNPGLPKAHLPDLSDGRDLRRVQFGVASTPPMNIQAPGTNSVYAMHVPREHIQSWISTAEQYCKGCNISAHELYIGEIILHGRTPGIIITELDAIEIRPGEYVPPSPANQTDGVNRVRLVDTPIEQMGGQGPARKSAPSESRSTVPNRRTSEYPVEIQFENKTDHFSVQNLARESEEKEVRLDKVIVKLLANKKPQAIDVLKASIMLDKIVLHIRWANNSDKTVWIDSESIRSGRYEKPYLYDNQKKKHYCSNILASGGELVLHPADEEVWMIEFPNFLIEDARIQTADFVIQISGYPNKQTYAKIKNLKLRNP